jgi:hypothetical protein
MHAAASRRFSLSKRLGLDCTKDGLTLAGVPLLHRTVRGFKPLDELEIRWLLKRAYGSALDTDRIIKGIETVAHALNEDRLGQATIRALLLDLHELDWPSAARLARADDALAKFDADEPRDERGRWASAGDVPRSGPHGLPPNLGRPPLRLITAKPDDVSGATPVQPADDPQAALDAQHWVSLPDGNRLDELGDLLEWAANATPEEAPRIRAAIKQTYYDVGDVRGGDALNRALSDGLEASSPTEREEILRTYEPYTREDPRAAAAFGRDLVSTILLSPSMPMPPIEAPEPSAFWNLSSLERGKRIHEALGENLRPNYPTIDHFLQGWATSIKSIDLNAISYQNDLLLLRRMNRYVDKLETFPRKTSGSGDITGDAIDGRHLELVVPLGSGNAAQRTAIAAAAQRAAARGINLSVTHF